MRVSATASPCASERVEEVVPARLAPVPRGDHVEGDAALAATVVPGVLELRERERDEAPVDDVAPADAAGGQSLLRASTAICTDAACAAA